MLEGQNSLDLQIKWTILLCYDYLKEMILQYHNIEENDLQSIEKLKSSGKLQRFRDIFNLINEVFKVDKKKVYELFNKFELKLHQQMKNYFNQHYLF